MIFTKALPFAEVEKNLNKEDIITIIGCVSCARVAGTAGPEQMKTLAMHLRKQGFTVKDGYAINTVCTPKVFQAELDKKVNTIITMACSAGVANVSRIFNGKKVVRSCYDVGLMTADVKGKTVKVAMPYEEHQQAKGQEFVLFSGESVGERVHA